MSDNPLCLHPLCTVLVASCISGDFSCDACPVCLVRAASSAVGVNAVFVRVSWI